MRCPKCGSLDDKVVDSRISRDGDSIRRRRECLSCFVRFTTYEEVERYLLRVIKRDGRSEVFDRNKLEGSFLKACEKRPISAVEISTTVQKIINGIEAENIREMTSLEIGHKVMEALRTMDAIAYVRYASVYREFQEVGDFLDEIKSLERRNNLLGTHPELFES